MDLVLIDPLKLQHAELDDDYQYLYSIFNEYGFVEQWSAAFGDSIKVALVVKAK